MPEIPRAKPPNKYRPTLRIIVVILIIVSIIYIRRKYTEMNSISNSVVELLYKTMSLNRGSSPDISESIYIHFPQPKTFNRGECIMNPVRYFIVLSLPRSGSLWLVSLLNSHTNITMYREIFLRRYRNQTIIDTIETLDKFYNMDLEEDIKPKNECTAALGFKWMLYQNVIKYRNVTVPYLKSNGVLPILLFRRNILRSIVSSQGILSNRLENVTDKYHALSKYEAELLASIKPTITTINLIHTLNITEKRISKCFKLFNDTPHIAIYYEDLVKNPNKFLDEVQDFLKVPRQKLISEQVKIHNGPLSSIVKNWEEVVATLNGTKYERFLYED